MSRDIVSHGIFASYSEALDEIILRINGDEHLHQLLGQREELSVRYIFDSE